MTAELAGKRALVTGAASGIGAACAIALAHAGARVVLADIGDANATLEELSGDNASAEHCDVSSEDSVAALFDRIAADSIDIVIHSAGILAESALEDTTSATFDRVMAVNLRGTFLVGKYALPLMRKAGDGRFIAVASELAYPGREGFSAYSASKAGVLGLVRSWAREFAPGVLVNALAPGPVDTPMLDLENLSAEWREKESNNPLGRVAQAEEIAAVAVFLSGPGASFMTGQTVSPNGGAVMF